MSKLESVPSKEIHSASKTPSFKLRKKWKNCVKNQVVQPLRYYRPETLEQLGIIIRYASENKFKVKAVGSGHSFSSILQTTDFLINCHSMNSTIDLEKNILKSEEELEESGCRIKYLAHIENGMRIRDLNDYLDSINLALFNMGGYDAQTIAGVISTSTHGTGITLGPIADYVASIIIVGEFGKIYRIEPKNGITDPFRYREKYPVSKLIQDNDYFNAVLVNMGCMGIIYSVIMKVRDKFFLEEKREGKEDENCWTEVKKLLEQRKIIDENRHIEVWVNPYKVKGENRCLMTTKNYYKEEIDKLPWGKRVRNLWADFAALFFEKTLRQMFRLFYNHSPAFINMSLKSVIDYDGYIDKSYNVLNLGAANNVKGFSSEYAISLKDNLYLKAVEIIMLEAERLKDTGKIFHTAPISLRFVKKCDAFFSMMNGEDKCLIEVPILVWTFGGFQILENLEKKLLKFGARPHWGQFNQLSGNNEVLKNLYPDYDKWFKVFCELNEHGTFDNSFIENCGFRKKVNV